MHMYVRCVLEFLINPVKLLFRPHMELDNNTNLTIIGRNKYWHFM